MAHSFSNVELLNTNLRTVEITNTDAEGRVVLGDGVCAFLSHLVISKEAQLLIGLKVLVVFNRSPMPKKTSRRISLSTWRH